MQALGVSDQLKQAGAKSGDTIMVGNVDFKYYEESAMAVRARLAGYGDQDAMGGDEGDDSWGALGTCARYSELTQADGLWRFSESRVTLGTCAHFRKGGEATGDLKMGSGDEVQARGVIPHRRGARWLAGCYWGGMGTARAACVAWARAVVASVSVSDVLRTLSTHTLRNASYTCCGLLRGWGSSLGLLATPAPDRRRRRIGHVLRRGSHSGAHARAPASASGKHVREFSRQNITAAMWRT
eukprot:scaffold26830_cov122-Isochrysis_galbana.AAC.3